MKLKWPPVAVYERWAIYPKELSRKQERVKFWTEPEIVLLIDLNNAGYTAKEIASQLGTRSHTAVAAKLQKIRHDQELIKSLKS